MKMNIARLVFVLLILVSCGGDNYSQNKGSVMSFEDVQEEVIDVLWDKSTTAERLTDVMIQYGEYLKTAAASLDNVNMRVDAQRRSLFTIQLLMEKFNEMDSLGQTVSPVQMDSCLNPLVDAISFWGYFNGDDGPMIYKELFYNSYQHSEEPVPGYFQIIVYLPTKKNPKPAVGIFYPQTAESNPLIVFTKDEVDGVPTDNWGNVDFAYPNALEKKNINGDGTPMNDIFGSDFLEKMLTYEHMYLIFYSESPAPGILGDREIARMDLKSFQDKYNEVSEDYEKGN